MSDSRTEAKALREELTNQALGADACDALRDLALRDQELFELNKAAGELPRLQLFHRVQQWVSSTSAAILGAEAVGTSKEIIRETLRHSRKIHAQSPWIKRLQDWPQGYQGDFLTVEQMIKGVRTERAATVPSILEEIALNSPAAQQHRNKVVIQEQMIRQYCATNGSILSVGCGGCNDAFRALDAFENSEVRLTINDLDEDALALSEERLKSISDRISVRKGNVVDLFRKKDLPQFDLILAGGLFDYLPKKVAAFTARSALNSLRSGGQLAFTNILTGNPYRPWIEHLANWELIERSTDELYALLESYRKDVEVSIEIDQTGLTAVVIAKKLPYS